MYYCNMYCFETKLRVRYAETDQMNFVYYGVYAQYYEVGRVELLRSIGISYKRIEAMGVALPVVSMNVQYKKPIFYDDQIIVKTVVREIPSSRITFFYEILDKDGGLLNSAEVVLAFLNKETGRVCQAPEIMIERLKAFF